MKLSNNCICLSLTAVLKIRCWAHLEPKCRFNLVRFQHIGLSHSVPTDMMISGTTVVILSVLFFILFFVIISVQSRRY